MAGRFTPFIPTGTIIKFSLLGVGDTTEPTETTITLGADAAKDTTAPATITVPALASGVSIPAFSYLTFETTAGGTIMVQTTALADAGDTSITVEAIPELIPTGAVASWPPRLQLRTGVDDQLSGNVTNYTTLDSPQELGVAVNSSSSVNVPGLFSPFDAAYQMARYCILNARPGWLEVIYPAPSTAYSTGDVIKGVVSVTEGSRNAASDGLVQADLSFTFLTVPTRVNPVAA